MTPTVATIGAENGELVPWRTSLVHVSACQRSRPGRISSEEAPTGERPVLLVIPRTSDSGR